MTIRCKLVVKAELENIGLQASSIEIGEVEINEELSDKKVRQLKSSLAEVGLELLEDKNEVLMERIKNVIIEMVHYSEDVPREKYSEYLSEKLGYNYTYLANVFSQVKGITVEQYIILHKIEKVKQLIIYDELSLSEIADKLNYSSAAHLSNQFKKVTGLTPSFFKGMKHRGRTNFDDL